MTGDLKETLRDGAENLLQHRPEHFPDAKTLQEAADRIAALEARNAELEADLTVTLSVLPDQNWNQPEERDAFYEVKNRRAVLTTNQEKNDEK